MELQDLFKRVLLRSGQFVMTQAKVELDEDRFVMLVEEAMEIYSKYSPLDKHLFVEVTCNRTHKFTEANTFGMGVPNAISSVTPIRMLGMNTLALRTVFNLPSISSHLDVRTECPYEWREPNLTLPYPGEFDVLAIYRHQIKKEELPGGKTSYTLPTIGLRDDAFMKMVRGMFLEGLGRSRRAFTLTDLPIVMDADAIAQEGRDMITEAQEQMQRESKFYLAFGG